MTYLFEILLHARLCPAFQRIRVDDLLYNVVLELDVRYGFCRCNYLFHGGPDKAVQCSVGQSDAPGVYTRDRTDRVEACIVD